MRPRQVRYQAALRPDWLDYSESDEPRVPSIEPGYGVCQRQRVSLKPSSRAGFSPASDMLVDRTASLHREHSPLLVIRDNRMNPSLGTEFALDSRVGVRGSQL